MPQRTDIFELGRLGLTSGEGRRIELHVAVAGFDYGGQRYEVEPALVPVLLDVSRTTGSGWAMRLRFEAGLHGPCMRCLDPADLTFAVDAREVARSRAAATSSSRPTWGPRTSSTSRPGRATRSRSPCPAQITCRPDCAGLCPSAARTSTRTRTTGTTRARPALVEAVRDPLRVVPVDERQLRWVGRVGSARAGRVRIERWIGEHQAHQSTARFGVAAAAAPSPSLPSRR